MANGYKTGGRVKGTPNKRTQDLTERLAELGCDPVEGMARLAMDPNSSPDLKGRMYAELAQYVYPKRRAVEQTVIEPKDEMTEEEILAQIRALIAAQPELMQQLESMKNPVEHSPSEVPLQ